MDERNPVATASAHRKLAELSAKFDFDEADEIDDDLMNQILWRGIKNTEPPAPTRSYFGR